MNNLPPRKFFWSITGIITVLLILHIGSYLHLLYYDLDPESFFFRKLNFDTEKNLPTIFAGLLHFTASFFLAVTALSKLSIKNSRWFWGSLSFVFFFFGLDEILVIHERFIGSINSLEEKGVFFYNWIFVYLAGAVVILIIFLKPLLSLPRNTMYKFLLSGFIFVFGATVLESIAGNIIYHRGIATEDVITEPIVFVLATFEELFEMLGVAFFIFALLDFLNKYSIAETAKAEPKRIIENYGKFKK